VDPIGHIEDMRHRLAHLERLNLASLLLPAAQEGSVGRDARVVGAMSLPLSERFFVIAGGTIALS